MDAICKILIGALLTTLIFGAVFFAWKVLIGLAALGGACYCMWAVGDCIVRAL
jgi:hypothetical protein